MKRCMFVDDSSVIRKVAKRILGGPDMSSSRPRPASRRSTCASADMPDIIVVDGALPDMTAVEFIRRVRAIESPVKPQIVDLPDRGRHRRDHARQARRRPGLSAEAVQPAAAARTLPRAAGARDVSRIANVSAGKQKPAAMPGHPFSIRYCAIRYQALSRISSGSRST